MSGDVGEDGMSSVMLVWVEERLAMPRRRQKASMEESEGRASPRGMEPSVRIALRSDCSERFRRRWGSGGTIGQGSSGVPTGEGLVGKGAFGP